jgi:TrkA-N domain/RyR domain
MTARARWFLIGLLWFALFVLASTGFRDQAQHAGIGRENLDIVYLIFQLITLQYNGAGGGLNWRLEIARFLAPAMAFSTVLQSASLVFADEFRRLRLQYVRNHTIICGLDDVGTRLTQAFAERGDRVVAIELDPSSPGIASARAAGATVLIGDATDAGLLRAARVTQAVRLVAVCGDDAANVQVAAQAVNVIGDHDGKALRCSVHLNDAELATLLRAADLDRHGAVRMSFFNTHERGARALLAENRPFTDVTGAGVAGARAHVVLFGLGQLGRSLVVNLAQQWAELDTGTPLRITLVDAAASGRWQTLCLQHPALAAACEATVLDFDFEVPSAESVDALRNLFEHDAPSWVAIAHAEEALSLSTAFFLYQSLGVRSVPVVIRTRTTAGLGALLIPGGRASGALRMMRVFPFLDRTCTIGTVEGGVREQLAQAVHEDYLGQLVAGSVNPLNRPWDELDDDERDLSRRRVDGILGDLAAIGCELGPLRQWGIAETTFSEVEIEQLARREHVRWSADRIATGWVYGATRDNTAKRNPLLVDWDELGDDARSTNIESARALPRMLARAGFELVRDG